MAPNPLSVWASEHGLGGRDDQQTKLTWALFNEVTRLTAECDRLVTALGEVDYIASHTRVGGPTMDGKQPYSSPRFGQIREIVREALTSVSGQEPVTSDG